jgi:predicted PurR-regulated permease PerM
MDMLGAYAKEHATQLFGVAAELVGTIASVAIGLVISVYVMISRHHLKWQAKKTVYAVFPQKTADYIRKVTKLGSKAVSNYIFARIIDSIIVGIICFVCMALFGFEYAALISFIVGVTNFIPILGPFLGGVPSALLLLLVSPAQCFWFIVFICVLQFLDSNFIDLRIAGEATGLPTLGVLTCVTAGGSLFGVVGFVMSVPVGAVVYRLVKDAVIRISREKNLPLNDEELRDRPTPKKLSSEEAK